jgi:cyclase
MTLARGRLRRCSFAAIVCAALCFVTLGAAVEPDVALAQASGTAPSGGLEVLQLRPNFFMIAGAGGNIGVQVGEDGVVVVDAGAAARAADVVAAIKRMSPKPIRYVINTGPDADHVGGNDVLSKAGDQFYPGTTAAGRRQDALRSVAGIQAGGGVVRANKK